VRTSAIVLAAGALASGGCGRDTAATTTIPATHPPPIVVDHPASGDRVGQTFHVSGTASVFEATLFIQTVRNGKAIGHKTVTASEGAPARGTFDTTMHASPGHLTVQVFSPSAVDGSPQHEVDVAVEVTP
jgi:hypothetical protein